MWSESRINLLHFYIKIKKSKIWALTPPIALTAFCTPLSLPTIATGALDSYHGCVVKVIHIYVILVIFFQGTTNVP